MAYRALDQDISASSTTEEHHNETGRGLYASRDISARESIISIQRPLVIALDVPRLKDTCYSCLGYEDESRRSVEGPHEDEDNNLQICTGCHVVRYCSKGCQRESWRTVHKHECALFARLHPNILPNNVRAITQILLLRKASKLPRGEWDDFMNLESHLQEWKSRGGQKWEDLSLMARGTKEYSGTDLSEETLREMFGKLLVNCFTMVSSCYDPLGLVLHPLAALANHSCTHNAFVRFDRAYTGHRLSIRALRPIARGEQVVISYIDATNPVHVRQKELQDRYFFTCECSKCSNALIKKEGTPTPQEPDDHLLIERRAFDLLASAQKDTSISGPIQKLQYGIHILRKTHTWPLHRQPLASLRQQLVVSLIAAGQLHLAFVHAWIQYRLIDHKLMPELYHPIRLVHQWLVFALVQRIVLEYYGRDSPDQKYNVLDRGINLSTILSYVLYNLYQKIKNEDTSSTFAQMVRRTKFRLLGRGSSRRNRIAQTDFNDESDKLKVCTTEVLEKELVWGDSKA